MWYIGIRHKVPFVITEFDKRSLVIVSFVIKTLRPTMSMINAPMTCLTLKQVQSLMVGREKAIKTLGSLYDYMDEAATLDNLQAWINQPLNIQRALLNYNPYIQ